MRTIKKSMKRKPAGEGGFWYSFWLEGCNICEACEEKDIAKREVLRRLQHAPLLYKVLKSAVEDARKSGRVYDWFGDACAALCKWENYE